MRGVSVRDVNVNGIINNATTLTLKDNANIKVRRVGIDRGRTAAHNHFAHDAIQRLNVGDFVQLHCRSQELVHASRDMRIALKVLEVLVQVRVASELDACRSRAQEAHDFERMSQVLMANHLAVIVLDAEEVVENTSRIGQLLVGG